MGQSPFLKQFSLSGSGVVQSSPPSNSVSHIVTSDTALWIGTGKGLARSLNGGRSWENFGSVPQFASPGIFSIDVRGDTVWASTGFTQDLNDQSIPTGSGYTYSTNNGTTWKYLPQTLDGRGDSVVPYGTINTVKFLPVVVPEQNVTYDLAVTSSSVWIASWASGLRKRVDTTWQRIVLPSMSLNSISPTDTLINYRVNPVPSPDGDNFKAFSVFAQTDSIIWAGTAGGINKSTDGGMSWTKFNTVNQQSHILGNWVIAIKGQQLGSTYRLWCTNWLGDQTFDAHQEYGVSYTDDGGRIWKNFLHGIKAYAFAFKDSIAYIATDDGVYRTADGGISWIRSGTITNLITGEFIASRSFFSVAVLGDTVYCGGGDGLGATIDNQTHLFGEEWKVVRTRPPGTYAYPNPFSPSLSSSNNGVVRLHFAKQPQSFMVTIEIFDFDMHRVRTVVKDAQRSSGAEPEELWNGRDDSGGVVTNGVYFYRVVIDNGDPVWGKVMVLQ